MDNWLIDNIEVGEASSGGGNDDCPSPQITSWTMTGDGTSFDGTNQSEIIGYQIEYSTSTFTPGDGTATVYEFDSFPHNDRVRSCTHITLQSDRFVVMMTILIGLIMAIMDLTHGQHQIVLQVIHFHI